MEGIEIGHAGEGVAVAVNWNGWRLGSAGTVAVITTTPGAVPRVTITLAMPALSVCTLAALSVAEPNVTEKFTVTPGTPDPAPPVTIILSGLGRGCPAKAVCKFPSAI